MWLLLPREIGLEATRIIEVSQLKQADAPLKKVGQRLGLRRSKRLKAMERKNIARVKYYTCGKKGH